MQETVNNTVNVNKAEAVEKKEDKKINTLAERRAEVESLSREALIAKSKADELVVTGDEELGEASNLISYVAKLKKQLEAAREKIVTPHNDYVKKVNEMFKRRMLPLDQARTAIEGKILQYRRAEQERIRKEQEALRKAAEEEQRKRAQEAEEKGTEPPAPAAVPYIAPPEKSVKAGLGTVTAKKTWTFEVADEGQVPREYLVVDDKKIRAAVQSGVREIPGVKIFETETLAVRGR